jgi:hypothetical protein
MGSTLDAKDSLEASWDEASAKLEKGWDSFTSSVKSFFLEEMGSI